MSTGTIVLHRLIRFVHDLIEAFRDVPEEHRTIIDTEIPLSANQQAEASSLSIALYQMGLIKRLPEPPEAGT
jgi:hypothetical protein